ncbi:putative Zn-binding protein involved in type VI secretion [Acinetobacter baylyi]|uniref:Zn-binding protein involved in type VI secretion n=1 Tax=Acinetobacter baylyi TaxID=202950 RepID=A0ABU0UYZ5_ACIBI|nr:PAAR domain-containing protein [Acinetobacter baylyi]MDQ1209790.1 putative Zn-binding protein involved in type VI secretion [Acinetobacter baylyi]MDR6106611.1 putative Zn-binding protein involved in type VI secretion [Acinetobacter baylyi]MDR6186660.1 putative Zn-binding protein involved in type VI secretion [Acinetobacter baylyi]
MATPYITIGCPTTTGGGQVISGNSMFLIDGIPVACMGDKASCPTHKVVATIVSGDPYMQIFGKAAARVNDLLSCGCKLLPKQNLVVQDNGGSTGSTASSTNNFQPNQIKEFGQKFLIVDESSSEPLANVHYEIHKEGSLFSKAVTDEQGYTQFISGAENEEIELKIVVEDKDHEHCCKP